MSLAPGEHVGSYEILSLLDEGGMGVVYRARDTRLDREVAFKVLPDSLTDDEERLTRFEREARLLAALNHPNVASVYGLEEGAGKRALVMELVDGRTLSSVLSEGPMRVAEALPIARQVCEALEAAHERGIVHRDLKPGNVMVRSDGTVKVLDFGLAKLVEPEADRSSDSEMESVPKTVMTHSGMILGTPPYMSPEQLEGRSADPRTDVWALGCLIYEMLVGRSAFGRKTAWQTVAAVMEQSPDLDRLPAATPVRIRLLVERCLRKDPHKRLHHVADARIEIEEALTEARSALSGPGPKGATTATPASRRWLASAATLALVATVVALAWTLLSDRGSSPAPAEPISFAVALPPGMSIGPGEVSTRIAVSPDGRRLAFVGNDSRSRLRVHEFATGTTRPLAGTEGAASPVWSPDGRFIGFFAAGTLKRVGLEGQPPVVISEAAWEAGNSWSSEDVILFAQPTASGIAIHRVPADGGDPVPVTQVDPEREVAHFWPHFLPDGRHFLYLSAERSSTSEPPRVLYLASLDGGERRPLLRSVSRAVYAPPGYLLYASGGVLVAQPFDAESLELTGEPAPVAEGLRYFYMTGQAEFSASTSEENPVVAFHDGGWRSEVVRYGRDGTAVDPLGEPDAFDQLRISPDGSRVVSDVMDPTNGGRDLWSYSIETGRRRRLTLHPADEQDPVWSPDGREILYRSDENGPPDLYIRSADGSGSPRRVLARPTVLTPEDWASDGRILYEVSSRSTGFDQWTFVPGEDDEPRPLLDTRYAEFGGVLSPDGRLVAFASNESGRTEVYVAFVDDPGARTAVSTDGGITPRWRRDGGELYFLGPERAVMVADVRREPSLETSEPRVLFQVDAPIYGTSYDASPDGRFFLVNQVVEDRTRGPIQVIMNWPGAIR